MSDRSGAADREAPWYFDAIRFAAKAVALAVAILLVLGAIAAGFWLLNAVEQNSEGRILDTALEQGAMMILLALVCFLVLVIVIVAMARSLATAQLQNHPHALGLPAGSVRAVIALAFLVFLAVMSVFGIQSVQATYVNVGDYASVRAENTTIEQLSASDVAGLRQSLRGELAAAHADERPWRVDFDLPRQVESDVVLSGRFQELVSSDRAVELAREVLTIVATALTAIVGFYFGSKSLSDGVGQAKQSPQEAIELELTLRRTLARLSQLVGPSGSIRAKEDRASAAQKSRIGEAKSVMKRAEEVLADVNSPERDRKKTLEDMRSRIDDMQKLEQELN